MSESKPAEQVEAVPEEFNKTEFLKKHLQHREEMNYRIEELMCMTEIAKKSFETETMLIDVKPPVNIVGDIHGQYADLHTIFATAGRPDRTRYLFLGDYVDRGDQQLETICCLLAWKINYPNQFKMLRGNHETRVVNHSYGFYAELIGKYGPEGGGRLWNAFNEVFDWMPVAALIRTRILCMHGGVGPTLKSLDQIKNINRPLKDVSKIPVAQDCLWADPCLDLLNFVPNTIRGVSWFFGENVVQELCERLDLDMIVRAHQVMTNGYGFFCRRQLVTIFSAPQYDTEINNMAAIMTLDEDLQAGFTLFNSAKNPENGEEEFRSKYTRNELAGWGYVSRTILEQNESAREPNSMTKGC